MTFLLFLNEVTKHIVCGHTGNVEMPWLNTARCVNQLASQESSKDVYNCS